MCFVTAVQVYHFSAEERQKWMLYSGLPARLLQTLSYYDQISLQYI